nr:hypothetical protein CFP56_33551 [Quercus suber]
MVLQGIVSLDSAILMKRGIPSTPFHGRYRTLIRIFHDTRHGRLSQAGWKCYGDATYLNHLRAIGGCIDGNPDRLSGPRQISRPNHRRRYLHALH